ncbi:unnamed protein product [Neospora caninum Liverpool]|uniref:AP2 domain transcription factor AP2III-1 n=1 Tax=Neospora caninum (strain Liverpool) TaxID=572307 RepID=F0V947_NEOCL|nr:uncharacterized protein NCLIV_007460 [Neospora caninum Liverpool]CBZ50272.1 unnamed protein product [Neospora caninum Liverpool]|eukprot:XP_003880306.1 uncharacterized protein NCLIV_007460 [Neospora caninum Liverpool]
MGLSPEARKARRAGARRLSGQFDDSRKEVGRRSAGQKRGTNDGRRERMQASEDTARRRRRSAGRSCSGPERTDMHALQSTEVEASCGNGEERRRKRGRPRRVPGPSTLSSLAPRPKQEHAATAGLGGRGERRGGRKRVKRVAWKRQSEAVENGHEQKRGSGRKEKRRLSLPPSPVQDSVLAGGPGNAGRIAAQKSPETLGDPAASASFTARGSPSRRETLRTKEEERVLSEAQATERGRDRKRSGGAGRDGSPEAGTASFVLSQNAQGDAQSGRSCYGKETHKLGSDKGAVRDGTALYSSPACFLSSPPTASPDLVLNPGESLPSPCLEPQPLFSLPSFPSLPSSIPPVQVPADGRPPAPAFQHRDVGDDALVPEGAKMSNFSNPQLLPMRLLQMLLQRKNVATQPASSSSQQPSTEPASCTFSPPSSSSATSLSSSSPSAPQATARVNVHTLFASCGVRRPGETRCFVREGPEDFVPDYGAKEEANSSTASSTRSRSPTVSLSSSFPPLWCPGGVASLVPSEASGDPEVRPSLFSVAVSPSPSPDFPLSPPVALDPATACGEASLPSGGQHFPECTVGESGEGEKQERSASLSGNCEDMRVRSFSPLETAERNGEAEGSGRSDEGQVAKTLDGERADEQTTCLAPSPPAPHRLSVSLASGDAAAVLAQGEEPSTDWPRDSPREPLCGVSSEETLLDPPGPNRCSEEGQRSDASPAFRPALGEGANVAQRSGATPLLHSSPPQARENAVDWPVPGVQGDSEAGLGAGDAGKEANGNAFGDGSFERSPRRIPNSLPPAPRSRTDSETSDEEEESEGPWGSAEAPDACSGATAPSVLYRNAGLPEKARGSEPTNSMFDFVEANRLRGGAPATLLSSFPGSGERGWGAEAGETGRAKNGTRDGRFSAKKRVALKTAEDPGLASSADSGAVPVRRLSIKDFFRKHYKGPALPVHPSCALAFGTSSESEGEEGGNGKKKKKERRVNVGAADALWQPHFHPHNQEFRVRYRYKGSMRLKTISCARFGREGAKRLTAAFVERWDLTGRRIAAKTHRSRLALVDLPQDTHLLPGYDKKRSGLASTLCLSATCPSSGQAFPSPGFFARTPQLGLSPFSYLGPQAGQSLSVSGPAPLPFDPSTAASLVPPSSFPVASRFPLAHAKKIQPLFSSAKPQLPVHGGGGAASAHAVAGNSLLLNQAARGLVGGALLLAHEATPGRLLDLSSLELLSASPQAAGAAGPKGVFAQGLTSAGMASPPRARRLDLAHLRRASPLLSSTFLSPATPAPVLPCSVPAASPRSLACGAAFQNPSLSQLPGRSVAAARSPPRGPLSASPLPLAPSSPLLVATSTSSSATPPPSGGETYQAPAALCSPENVVRGTHGSGSPLLSGSSASAPSSSPAASFTLTSLSSRASLLSPLLSEPAKLAQARPKGVDLQALWLHLQNQFRATSKAATEWSACLENRTTGTASPLHSVAQGTERAGAMDIQRAAAEPGNSRPGLTAGERAEKRRSGIKETERLEEGMCSPPLATRSGAESEPAKEEERGHGQQEGSAHHLQPVNATGAYDLRREQSRVQVLHGGERSHESPETLGPLPTSGERPFSGETEERNEQLPQQKGWPNVAGRQPPTNPSFPGVQAIGFGPAANLPPAGHATVVGAVSHLVSAGGALEKANKS